MWLWLALTLAYAQDLTALDALSGFRGRDWGSPPASGMVRLGGNGPERDQYRWPFVDPAVGPYIADAVTYEYVGGALATGILAFRSQGDGSGVLRQLEAAYGPATWQDPVTAVWRGERVRLVWRAQRTDLYVVTYVWLPLHAADPAPAPLPSPDQAPR